MIVGTASAQLLIFLQLQAAENLRYAEAANSLSISQVATGTVGEVSQATAAQSLAVAQSVAVVAQATVAAITHSLSVVQTALADAPVPHRYWRINVTENQSGALTAISELQLYETEFGEQVATGGTASADSESGGHDAAHGFDGEIRSDSTYVWASSGGSLPHWLAYDLGVGVTKIIRAVGIHPRWGGDVSQAPKDFDVQYSDNGSSWTTYWSVADCVFSDRMYQRFVKSGAEDVYSGSPHGSHSHWRILVEEIDAGSLVCIGEMEWRATPSGSDQATGGTAVALSEFGSGFEADKAFDGSGATSWVANASRGWLRYDFASPVEVGEVSITARNSDEGQPKMFAIQWADSSSGPWTTAWMEVNETGWSLSETRTYTDPNYI